MRLTEEQFQALAKNEPHFNTALKADWSRYPGDANLREMDSINRQLNPKAQPLRYGCTTCMLRLIKELGTIYFADKAERENEKVVETSTEEKATVKKASVKTKK